MPEKNESDDADSGIYLDSSAVIKLYAPEQESDALDGFLQRQHGLMISELCVTEVTSAVARRRREGVINSEQANEIRKTLLSDVGSGAFRILDLTPAIHRQAERMLLATEKTPLRTLDALHIALALSEATRLITFDDRMAEAAALQGLEIIRL